MEHGADPDAADKQGQTPHQIAAEGKNATVATTLTQRGTSFKRRFAEKYQEVSVRGYEPVLVTSHVALAFLSVWR